VSQTQLNRSDLREERSRQNAAGSSQNRNPVAPPAVAWNTEAMLDTTYNRLQELMQLLYLLSRDPAVPNEARYHVTVAQSEIALLSRVMHNSTQADGAAIPCSSI
jgi:hypothetical protein